MTDKAKLVSTPIAAEQEVAFFSEHNQGIMQVRMDKAIDEVLDTLDQASAVGVEIDPLATIIDRVKARGAEIDLSTAPPLMQMLLSGMLDG